MKRKTWTRAFLVITFLGSTYAAVSQTNSDVLAPFLVKECVSLTVGSETTCHKRQLEPLTLQDVEKALQGLSFPLPTDRAPAPSSPAAVQGVTENPLLAYACQFSCPDALATGALAKNAQEKVWNSDGLFHVIERSRKCSASTMDELRGTYCTCSHQ
jgi:hypothetical protein